MPQHAHVAHRIPGRVRVKVPHLKNNPQAAQRLNRMAASIKGIKKVEASSVTGSMVVHYDKDSVDSQAEFGEMMNSIGSILSVAIPEVGEAREIGKTIAPDVAYLAEHVPALAPLTNTFRIIDDKVKSATYGSFDLATLAPILLGGCFILLGDSSKSIRRSVMIGGLLFASLHSYMALHQGRNAAQQQQMHSANM